MQRPSTSHYLKVGVLTGRGIKDLLPTPAVDTENSVGHTEILGIHLTTKTENGNEYETYFGNETGISSDLKRPLTDISKKTLDELLRLIQPI